MFAHLLGAVPSAAFAQAESGRISGTVVDPQGAAAPGVRVDAVSSQTGAARTTTTDSSGFYVLPNLQAARYDVSFSLQGFRTAVARAQVSVGAAVTLDASLEVGAVEETVAVTAAARRVDTRTPEVSATIDERQVSTLPTLTRNPYDFVALAGNVSRDDQVPVIRGAQGFAINGQRAASTNVLLDGAANNDEFTASVGQPIPLDAVQELRVITSNFSAQYGRASGGIVNLVTRAGSNEFHGTGDYFYRNESLTTETVDQEARGLRKSPFSRHQPAFTIGGPLKKNVAQFFVAGEYVRVRSTRTNLAWIPSPAFLARAAPATQTYFSRFTSSGSPTGAVFSRGPDSPVPELQQVAYDVASDAGAGLPQNTLAVVGRIDWTAGSKGTGYLRYAISDQDLLAGTNSYSPYAGFDTGSRARDHNVLLSMTRVWASHVTSQSKAVVSRLASDQPLAPQGVVPGLYLAANVPVTIGGVPIALPGYLPYSPGTAIPFGGPQTLVQLYHDQTVLKGRHDLRFGASYVHIMDDRTFGAFESSVMTLGSNLSGALDNLTRGQLQQFEVAVDPGGTFPGETIPLPVRPPSFTRHNRYNDYALYANDSWTARSLTVSLGLRYEYYGVQHNTDPSLDSNFYYGRGASLPAQIRSGTVLRATDSAAGGLWAPDRNNFAPRLGIAWDPRGDGRMSVRGGYGMAYERNFGNVTFNVIQNPPSYAVVSLVAGVDVPVIPISSDNAGPLAGTGSTRLPPVSLRHIDEHLTSAYAHFWSASFQEELRGGAVVSLDYTGSKGVDLYLVNRVNGPGSGAVYLGDAIATSRENAQYSTINSRTNGGRSLYHGVTVGADLRNPAATGLDVSARYTLSRAQDDLSTTFSESSNDFNVGLLDPYHPDLDWADASFDIRHRFVASATWNMPGPRSGFANQLFGGWQASGIFTAQSGLPFSVYDCTNAVLTCNRLVPVAPLAPYGSTATGDPNTYVYLDLRSQLAGAGAYRNAITGTSDFGPYPATMTGRNAFRAPGRWDMDIALAKRFELRGGHGLRLRLELYNPLQHANLYVDTASADISSHQFITAVGGATSTLGVSGDGQRRLQVACKYEF